MKSLRTLHLAVMGTSAVVFDKQGPICSIHPLLVDSLENLDLFDLVDGRTIGTPSFDQAEMLADIEDANVVMYRLFARLGVEIDV